MIAHLAVYGGFGDHTAVSRGSGCENTGLTTVGPGGVTHSM